MKLSAMLQELGINNINDVEISGIAIDSRKVQPGDLYVCISGLNVDRHDYAAAAEAAGAAAVLCEREIEGLTIPQVVVENCRFALCFVSDAFFGRPASGMKIIGVTGTNGKTSTVYFIEQILRKMGKTVGAIGTLEAKINGVPMDTPFATSTTPDTIELYRILRMMADRGVEYVVMEVSSHALALDKVSAIRFRLGLFTNLSQDHLDFHGTMEAYLQAKSVLFSLTDEGITNADDETVDYLLSAAKCPMFTYGIEGGNYRADDVKLSESGVNYAAFGVNVRVNIPSKFTVYNTLCAFAAAVRLGFAPAEIASALAQLGGVPGRVQRVPNDKGLTVIVDYAHTPDALVNVLTSCRDFTAGRLICVFGCGGDRDPLKRPLMGEAVGQLSNLAVITSDNPRNEKPESIIEQVIPGIEPTGCEYVIIIDRKEAIAFAISQAAPDDCVVIAGKGHEDYQEFENGLKIHFDDSEIAAEILST